MEERTCSRCGHSFSSYDKNDITCHNCQSLSLTRVIRYDVLLDKKVCKHCRTEFYGRRRDTVCWNCVIKPKTCSECRYTFWRMEQNQTRCIHCEYGIDLLAQYSLRPPEERLKIEWLKRLSEYEWGEMTGQNIPDHPLEDKVEPTTPVSN